MSRKNIVGSGTGLLATLFAFVLAGCVPDSNGGPQSGANGQPVAQNAQIVFFDSEAFDTQLSRNMASSRPNIVVEPTSAIDLNSLPPRMSAWFHALQSRGGELTIVRQSDGAAQDQRFFEMLPSMLIGPLTNWISGKIREELVYGDAGKYDAVVLYSASTGAINSITFKRRGQTGATPVAAVQAIRPSAVAPLSTAQSDQTGTAIISDQEFEAELEFRRFQNMDPTSLPPAPRAAPTEFPKIVVVQPNDGQSPVKAPVTIMVKFEPSPGATINPSSFRAQYGFLGIDVTSRVLAESTLTADGLEARNVDIPAGSHRIVLRVADSTGRPAELDVRFVVTK